MQEPWQRQAYWDQHNSAGSNILAVLGRAVAGCNKLVDCRCLVGMVPREWLAREFGREESQSSVVTDRRASAHASPDDIHLQLA